MRHETEIVDIGVDVAAALRELTYREREIIKLRHGIGDGYTYTLEEVARIFKVTRDRIRAVEARAVSKMIQSLRSYGVTRSDKSRKYA